MACYQRYVLQPGKNIWYSYLCLSVDTCTQNSNAHVNGRQRMPVVIVVHHQNQNKRKENPKPKKQKIMGRQTQNFTWRSGFTRLLLAALLWAHFENSRLPSVFPSHTCACSLENSCKLLADHDYLCNMQYADVKNLSSYTELLCKILELVTISQNKLRLEGSRHHSSKNNCGQDNIYSLCYTSVFI